MFRMNSVKIAGVASRSVPAGRNPVPANATSSCSRDVFGKLSTVTRIVRADCVKLVSHCRLKIEMYVWMYFKSYSTPKAARKTEKSKGFLILIICFTVIKYIFFNWKYKISIICNLLMTLKQTGRTREYSVRYLLSLVLSMLCI